MRRRTYSLAKDCGGNSVIEFAFVAPLLCLLMIGMAQFGITLNNYVNLTSAVGSGARNLALSRGASTPYSSTTSLINSAAVNLTTASLTITIRVNGTACSTDTTCSTALTPAHALTSSVSATYPCNLTLLRHHPTPASTLSPPSSTPLHSP